MTFTPVDKDRLFYDQYRYCISFFLEDAYALRSSNALSHDSIDKHIAERHSWRARFGYKATTQDAIDKLHAVCDVLMASTGAYKKVVYSNGLNVYSNDLSTLQSLNDLHFVQYPVLSEAQVTLPRDTLLLKTSDYKFRTYFKMKGVTKQQMTNLNDFFKLNQEIIKPSTSLKKSVASYRSWLMDHHFVDHSDPKLITVINLVCPGITRKTLNIMAAK
jgi:hypothetical protein